MNENYRRAQVIPLVAVFVAVFLGLAAFVVDLGFMNASYQELVTATDAAALAAGAAIPSGTAATVASTYSAVAGDANAGHPTLSNVTVKATLECLTSSSLPPCSVYGSQKLANAVQVTETASAPTFFAHVLGINSFPLSVTATASAKGGSGGPFNIEMVLDTTQSMNQTDQDCGGVTQEQCALAGIRTFLGELDPCYANLTTCPSPNTKPVDEVALMTFPGLCSSALGSGTCPTAPSVTTSPGPTAVDDYACPGGTSPATTSYNNDPAYAILPLENNYRSSDTSGLATGSAIVEAVGGNSNCAGVQAPGGQGTFYAGAIYAAQAALVANARANVQNVMIILSDGDANATACSKGQGDMCGSATSYAAVNECAQAIAAATAAKAAGTQIYSISYGSESTGCSTDTPAITPCTTMSSIASLPLTQYFFSNAPSGGGSAVCPGGRANSSIGNVFAQIGSDLTVARLIPNGTT